MYSESTTTPKQFIVCELTFEKETAIMCQLEHNMKNELSKQYVFDEVVVPCGYITKSSFFC